MNKSLTRTIAFWLLLILSIASAGVGGWLISGQLGTMTSTLLDGTATGVEVYVGQSLIVVGAALLGAGVVGVLLALGLSAVGSILPSPSRVVVEPIDWTSNESVETSGISDANNEAVVNDELDADDLVEVGDQNGSSGSIATATKINVK